MPLVNVIVGIILVGVPLWLVFVVVVVQLQSSDPGEPIQVDERVARPGCAIVCITGNGGVFRHHDSGSARRAQMGADSQEILGMPTEGKGELYPVASNETEYGREQNRRVETAIQPSNKMKKVAENG